ncbi:MAG: DUF4886 domain-containing protein [Clostridia bacterium]|nr:DUF4886 domain-containing protein [Clostridia bacterium]
MKRTVAFLLAVTMMFGLCACGAQKPADDNADKGENTTTTITTTTTETEGTTTTTEAEGTTTETEAPATTTGTETEAPTTEGTKAPTTTADKKPTKTEAPATTTGTKKPATGYIPPVPTSTEKPTTSTTKKPTTTTTTTTEPIDTRPTIKILSIGHSFSVDAMKTYMPELFQAAGYNATIAYLYYPGCALERHYHYIKEDKRAYQQYNKCVDGTWKNKGTSRVTDALWDEDWDIVTFQPSPDYGQGKSYKCDWGCNKTITNDYVHFNETVNLVKGYLASDDNKSGPNTDVKFYYHLTWAFSEDCELWSYMYSNFDQMTMYNDFLKATKDYVLPNKQILGYIPCITSVQNARTSWMGDTFNEPVVPGTQGDGYHLNDKGDLVAAMTWVAYFTGKDANSFKISTKYSDDEYAAIAEAVNNAIKTPDKVTESSYKTEP